MGVLPLTNREKKAGALARPYARTPFLLGISGKNYKNLKLTTQEVENIFKGIKKTWPNGDYARFILRPKSDSDTTLLLKWFPNIKNALALARKRRGIIIAESDQMALDAAQRVHGSITTSTLSAILAEKRPIFPISIDGIEPTSANVQSGRHKWYKELLLITTKAQSKAVKDYISYIGSAEGRRILLETGNLPLD